MRAAAVVVVLLLSACGGDSPTAPTPQPAAPVTSMTPLTISGGDPVCTIGPLTFACKSIGPYKVVGDGVLSARLAWQDRETNLLMFVYDAAGRTVASGGNQVRTDQGLSTSATTNVSRGDYYVYVFWVWGSNITPIEVTVTYPGA